MKKFLITLTIALIVASSTFAQTAKEVKGSTLSDDQIVEIATQAYVYGYPLILMDHTKRIITNVAVPNNYGSAPVNQISHYRSFPDHTNTEVVKMNVDTYYSFVWFDLSAEPMVLSVPATERYYLLPLLDAYSNVFASPARNTILRKELFLKRLKRLFQHKIQKTCL